MKKILLIFIALTFCMGCQSEKTANDVVSFKGGNLTAEDLDAHYRKLRMTGRYKNTPEQLTPEFVFDHAVNMEMIIAKGLQDKLHLDPYIRAEIHDFMSNLFLKVMQDKLVPKIEKNSITEEEMKSFYNAHKDSYTKESLYSVRMIKTKDKETARKVAEKIKGKSISFEDAAKAYSLDEKSGKKGGIIGARSLRKFRADWRPAIESLKVDEVSDPEKIKEDYYIFKLVKKTDAHQYSFEEKKAYIRNDVLYLKYSEEWQKVYDGLKKEFSVKINEEKLEEFLKKRADV
ncbi:MAG: peptidyl-prolyl cis-trans isomerase [Deltaproteobacteria bacterium]|nr:peptidyl-prolyl cis-trans isomerase [Deltaproteobacteria bacterium]